MAVLLITKSQLSVRVMTGGKEAHLVVFIRRHDQHVDIAAGHIQDAHLSGHGKFHQFGRHELVPDLIHIKPPIRLGSLVLVESHLDIVVAIGSARRHA